jgi:hypothetical protein
VDAPKRLPLGAVKEKDEEEKRPSPAAGAENSEEKAPLEGSSSLSSFARLDNPPKSDFLSDFGDDSSPACDGIGLDARLLSPPNNPDAGSCFGDFDSSSVLGECCLT